MLQAVAVHILQELNTTICNFHKYKVQHFAVTVNNTENVVGPSKDLYW
jgi:hypothetical protein